MSCNRGGYADRNPLLFREMGSRIKSCNSLLKLKTKTAVINGRFHYLLDTGEN